MVALVGLLLLLLFFCLTPLEKKKEYVQNNCLDMDRPINMHTRTKITHLCIHIHSNTPSYTHISETLDGNEP